MYNLSRGRKVNTLLSKIKLVFLFVCLILSILVIPVYASDYSVGVAVGDFVKFGDFVGNSSYSYFSDVNWTKYEVTAISGTNVTMIFTAVFKNGTDVPGSGNTAIYDIEKYTVNGAYNPAIVVVIIPANLTEGNEVPGAGVNVTTTENRNYFGIDRSVNIVETNSTSVDITYMSTLVYDTVSGVALEVQMEKTDSTDTATVSYDVIETNIFTGEVIPDLPSNMFAVLVIISLSVGALVLRKKMLKPQNSLCLHNLECLK